jgi:hypothetical protein
MEKTKFELACAKLGRSTDLPDVSKLPKEIGEYIVNHYILITLIEAKNNGKRADFTDPSTWKYFPWALYDKDATAPSGFVLTYSDYGLSATRTGVGSRLCLHSSEDAMEALTEFHEEFVIDRLK